MANKKTLIPLCRSDFLQDITIALGRRRKGLNHRVSDFTCEVGQDSSDGQLFERLTISCGIYEGSMICLHLWSDQTAQVVVVGPRSKAHKRTGFWFNPDVSNFTPEGIVEALKQSASNTNSETQIAKIWEYSGELFTKRK